MPDLSDTKRKVIEKAKTLRREGKNYRYFSVDGEIWECYQAEYLPDIGERAWFSMPITIFVMDKLMFKPEIDILVNENANLHAQWLNMLLTLNAAKAAMATAQMHLHAASVQFATTDDAIIMRHVEDAYRAIRDCRINIK